jgi:S-disulfanyl-L-cysteine oxidoreductase SoxD
MEHQLRNPQYAAWGIRHRGHSRLGQTIAWLLLGLAVVGCAMAPPGPTSLARPTAPIPPAASPEELAAGTHLYQQYCAHCHGEVGRAGLASPLDQNGHAWHHPDSVLTQTIIEGNTRSDLAAPDVAMPPFGAILSPTEVRTLIAFFKAAWTPDQQRFQWERTDRADIHMH